MLVERAELQRGELGRAFAEFERPAHWFNVGLMAAGWLRSSPAVAGLSAAGATLALGKLRGWVGKGLIVWQVFKFIVRHIPERHEASVNDVAAT
ncbi:MAG TPA: hypothetical protein VGM16_09255 [Gammaproteobacteria bacterium]